MEINSIIHENVYHSVDEDIIVNGSIDDNSNVILISRRGNITIRNKIDNNCTVKLIAAGFIRIGTEGGDVDGDRKIDNNCSVEANAGEFIHLGSRINNHCNVKFKAKGDISIGSRIDDNSKVTFESSSNVSIGGMINNNSSLDVRALHDITINGKIDDNSNTTLNTLRGGITITGKIDNNTVVTLNAARDVIIGTSGGSDDRKINNACYVYVRTGGQIQVGDKLGDNCVIQFRSCGPINIIGVVERGCHASFETREGNNITVKKIRDNNTSVTFWGGNLIEQESRHQTPRVQNLQWVDAPLFCSSTNINGEWWQNWSWKYGYVVQQKLIPRTVEELVEYIAKLDNKHRTKSVGGAWSFSDASLPFDSLNAVNNVSIEKRGIGQVQRVKSLFEGAGDARVVPFDHQPNTLFLDLAASKRWDQSQLTNIVESGFNLPGAPINRSIIDTKQLCSSLQNVFYTIQSNHIKNQLAEGRHFFHVEAGITMENLYTLLDHQKPRLAIQATGGSRGATLGGTLSTATHGGEFKFPLLIDRVKAIHLVGPGGEEWWIEGEESIANFDSLTTIYPNIDSEHFIAAGWKANLCGDQTYTPIDVLRAVTVSMGTIGVIYSVVLEVVPAYGIQQKVIRIGNWSKDILNSIDVTEDQLRAHNPIANRKVLDFILDGAQNGTGIPRSENIYIDLALNPVTKETWITNRRITSEIPRESKELDSSIDTYIESFNREISTDSSEIYKFIKNSPVISRLMDFLNYGRSVTDVPNVIPQFIRLINFVMNKPPLISTLLSTANAQLTLNETYRTETNRKRQIVGEILTGLLNVLKGTTIESISDITGPSSKIGATGFSDEGLPGKALEIALPPEIAFSFFQTILDRFDNPESPPLIGYVAIRVVPQTQTLMGMQQFEDFSVMIEPFAFRTPESLVLIQQIMDDLATLNANHYVGGMLHWGLENDTLTRERFENSAVTKLYGSTQNTKLVVFKAIKKMIQNNHAPVFDNWFVKRLGLDDYLCELREVTATQKRGRNVVGLCNPGQFWSPVSEVQAVRDIRSRGIRYFVNQGGRRVFLRVMEGGENGYYLQTTSDGETVNNLIDLPDC